MTPTARKFGDGYKSAIKFESGKVRIVGMSHVHQGRQWVFPDRESATAHAQEIVDKKRARLALIKH